MCIYITKKEAIQLINILKNIEERYNETIKEEIYNIQLECPKNLQEK